MWGGQGWQCPTAALPSQFPRATTLEVFSVAVAQLLGLSLGMNYDDPGSCGCAGAACIMRSSAV